MDNNNCKPKNEDGKLPIYSVSSRFSLLILSAKLLELEVKWKENNLQMLEYPNEYSDKILQEIEPMLKDLRRAVAVLENGY